MKSTILGLAAHLVFCGAALTANASDSPFDENFDQDPPYADNLELPKGFGKDGISHGRWQVSVTPDRGTAKTVRDQFLSAPHSLRLSVTESSDSGAAGVNVWGTFAENKSKSISVSDAITLKFAFRMENTEAQTKGVFAANIMGAPQEKPAQVRINRRGESFAEANFGDEWIRIPEKIEPGKWYRLEIAMPSDPANAEGEYTVRLYDAEGKTMLGAVSGRLSAPAAENAYSYFSIGNTMPGTSVYVDDVTVDTAK